jgi:hypothetical protein
VLYGVFVVFFLVLGYLGIQPPSDIGTLVSQVGTLFYFGFFLLMPWWSPSASSSRCPTAWSSRRTEAGARHHEKTHCKSAGRAGFWFRRPGLAAAARLGQVPHREAHRHGGAAERRQAVRQLLPELPSAAFMRYNRLRTSA